MEINSKPSAKSEVPLNTPSSFFEGCIEILIVDDEPSILELYSEYLNQYKMYNVSKASCIKQAKDAFFLKKRIHVCIMDLGLTDINKDEYYLLNKFHFKTSFIVVTGRDSLETGFKARDFGAYAAIKKPVNFEDLSIINHINNAFLQSLIKKGTCENNKSIIIDAVNVLITRWPSNMKKWVEMLNIDEGYLRKVWIRHFGYPPRYLFFLFKTFLQAFEYYNCLYSYGLGLKNKLDSVLCNDFKYIDNQVLKIYQKHQKEIDLILKE